MKKNKRLNLKEEVIRTLRWVGDLEGGGMIECSHPPYRKDYLAFNLISQDHLDYICDIVNLVLKIEGSKYIIRNSMGEIIPNIRKEI